MGKYITVQEYRKAHGPQFTMTYYDFYWYFNNNNKANILGFLVGLDASTNSEGKNRQKSFLCTDGFIACNLYLSIKTVNSVIAEFKELNLIDTYLSQQGRFIKLNFEACEIIRKNYVEFFDIITEYKLENNQLNYNEQLEFILSKSEEYRATTTKQLSELVH